MTDETNYYIPLTIDELADGLKSIVKNSEDLTGNELIVGIDYIHEEDMKVPPGSIAVYLQQNTLDPDEPKYETIVLTPGKVRRFM